MVASRSQRPRRRRIDLPRPTMLFSVNPRHPYEVAYVEGREIWSADRERYLGGTDECYEDVVDEDGLIIGCRERRQLLDHYNQYLGHVRVDRRVVERRTKTGPFILFTYRGDYRAAGVAAVRILSNLYAPLTELITD